MCRHVILSLWLLSVGLLPSALAASSTTLADASVYALQAPLVDQDGHTVGFDTFAGTPTIISMFYASCPSACPMLINSIKQMEASLTAKQRARLRILLISVDPEHDTPAALRKVAVTHELDLTRWKLAQPTSRDVRKIAAVLNISYRKTPTGDFNHSSLLTLVDGRGVPLAHEEGAASAARAIATRLRAGVLE